MADAITATSASFCTCSNKDTLYLQLNHNIIRHTLFTSFPKTAMFISCYLLPGYSLRWVSSASIRKVRYLWRSQVTFLRTLRFVMVCKRFQHTMVRSMNSFCPLSFAEVEVSSVLSFSYGSSFLAIQQRTVAPG